MKEAPLKPQASTILSNQTSRLMIIMLTIVVVVTFMQRSIADSLGYNLNVYDGAPGEGPMGLYRPPRA